MVFEECGFLYCDVLIFGYDGDEIVVIVIEKEGCMGMGLGFFYMYGGGMIIGN